MRTIAVVAMSAALLITASVATPVLAATPDTWHVQVGSGTFGPSGFVAAGNAFYPGRIAVHQGDSIVFTRVSPHTITFNPPAAPVFAFFGPPTPSSTLATPSTFVSSNFDPTRTSLPPFTVTIGSSLSPGSCKYPFILHDR